VEKFSGRAEDGLLEWEKRVAGRYFSEPGRLLDVGCGGGREAIAFAKLGHSVTAIDINKSLIETAESKAHELGLEIKVRLCDGAQLEFDPNAFKYIVLFAQVLGNVPGHDQRVNMLRQAHNILTEDGVLIFSVHNLPVCEPIAYAQQLIVKGPDDLGSPRDYMILEDKHEPPCYWHYFTREELEKLCDESDFSLIECCTAYQLGQGEGWDKILVCVCRPRATR
jgi:SAM-dependent methyltransferase